MHSVDLTVEQVMRCHAELIATDHDAVDCHLVNEQACIVIDTRNAMGRRGFSRAGIIKA